MLLVLAINVFMTCEIHSVTEASDDESICNGEECKVLVVADVLMQVHNWLVIEGRISAVDTGYYVDDSGLMFHDFGRG